MNVARPATWSRRSSLLATCAWWHFVWAITVCPAIAAELPAALNIEGESRFQRTVQYLQDAPAEVRGDFAAIALSSLTEAYIAEARLAREKTRTAGHDAGLRSWSVAVDYYARQMPLLLEDIELGLPVRLTLGGEKSLSITVADRIVILSHPRFNQQSVFEQGILADFCSRHDCEQFTPGNAELEPIPVSAVQVRPDWTFTAQGRICSYKGIKILFNSEQNLANSLLICEQFLQEVMTLANEFAWQQRHAVPIEWDKLDIQSTPRRPEHMVRLNSAGDSVLVTVPLLYGSPGLLEHVVPWIQLRLSNHPDASIELHADHYGWENP